MKTTIQIVIEVLHLLSNPDLSPDDIIQKSREIIMQDRVEQHEATCKQYGIRCKSLIVNAEDMVTFESTQEDE